RRSYPRPSPFREPRGLVHGLQVSPTSCGRAVSFPQYLRFPLGLPDPPCQHEQRVAEPVQKLEYCRIDRLLSREPHGVTLRAATHGPRLVEQGGHLSSPGRMNSFSGARSFWHASIKRSKRVTSFAVICGMFLNTCPGVVARMPPASSSLF